MFAVISPTNVPWARALMATTMDPDPLPVTAVTGLVAELDPAQADMDSAPTTASAAASVSVNRRVMDLPPLESNEANGPGQNPISVHPRPSDGTEVWIGGSMFGSFDASRASVEVSRLR